MCGKRVKWCNRFVKDLQDLDPEPFEAKADEAIKRLKLGPAIKPRLLRLYAAAQKDRG